MGRPAWFVDLIRKSFPSRFRLAPLTRVPLLRQVVDHALFAGDDIIYLPRDEAFRSRRIEINEAPAPMADMVLPSSVVTHFVEEAAYHWIMDFCICRDSSGCHDYPVELGCLFLGEAVLKIDPELGHLASKEEALDHLQRCREMGLVHLVGRNKLDTVWLGATPGNKLLTICNCCPCCCLWKMLPRLDQAVSRKVTRMPGVTVNINGDCKGCKLCIRDVCFVDAIQMEGKRAVIDQDLCRGCGRCVEVCPLGAIDLTVSGNSVIDEAIERIAPLVDLA